MVVRETDIDHEGVVSVYLDSVNDLEPSELGLCSME